MVEITSVKTQKTYNAVTDKQFVRLSLGEVERPGGFPLRCNCSHFTKSPHSHGRQWCRGQGTKNPRGDGSDHNYDGQHVLSGFR